MDVNIESGLTCQSQLYEPLNVVVETEYKDFIISPFLNSAAIGKRGKKSFRTLKSFECNQNGRVHSLSLRFVLESSRSALVLKCV